MSTATSPNVDATPRATKAWIRCIALGALAVGLADWLQAYLVPFVGFPIVWTVRRFAP